MLYCNPFLIFKWCKTRNNLWRATKVCGLAFGLAKSATPVHAALSIVCFKTLFDKFLYFFSVYSDFWRPLYPYTIIFALSSSKTCKVKSASLYLWYIRKKNKVLELCYLVFNSLDAIQYFLVGKYQTNLMQRFEKSQFQYMLDTKSHTWIVTVFLGWFLNNGTIILV